MKTHEDENVVLWKRKYFTTCYEQIMRFTREAYY